MRVPLIALFIAAAFSLTVCVLSLRGALIPDALDRLSIFILGGVSGLLAKTSTDKPQPEAPSGTPTDPVNVAQTAPVEITNAPSDVIETKPAEERDGTDHANVS